MKLSNDINYITYFYCITHLRKFNSSKFFDFRSKLFNIYIVVKTCSVRRKYERLLQKRAEMLAIRWTVNRRRYRSVTSESQEDENRDRVISP